MSAEQEKRMLSEIREMMALDKSQIAEKYKVPLDTADDYAKTKTVAVLDVILDGLAQEIAVAKSNAHYKGATGAGDMPRMDYE